MNNLTRGIIGLTIFGAGVGAGYLFTNKIIREHYAEIAQDEIEQVKEYYYNKYNQDAALESNTKNDIQFKDDTDYTDDPFNDMTEEEIEEARKEHSKIINDYNTRYKEHMKTNYSSFYEKPSIAELSVLMNESSITDEEEYDEDEDEELLNKVDSNLPYIITETQYLAECDHYAKEDIFWYVEDDVVCDSDDNPIEDDLDAMIGHEVFNMSANDYVTYIRNEPMGVDYVFYRLNDSSYARDVVGAVETPSEREYRQLSRKKQILDK